MFEAQLAQVLASKHLSIDGHTIDFELASWGSEINFDQENLVQVKILTRPSPTPCLQTNL